MALNASKLRKQVLIWYGLLKELHQGKQSRRKELSEGYTDILGHTCVLRQGWRLLCFFFISYNQISLLQSYFFSKNFIFKLCQTFIHVRLRTLWSEFVWWAAKTQDNTNVTFSTASLCNKFEYAVVILLLSVVEDSNQWVIRSWSTMSKVVLCDSQML